MLQFYSTKLSCVEVDTSTYTIPTVNRVQKWLGKTPKGFVFHFKAHQIFTHQHTDYAKLPRLIRESFPHPKGVGASEIDLKDIPEAIQEQLMFLFNLALKEAHNASKLGVVVFQFPESFGCCQENKDWILKLRGWLEKDFVMGVEFRSHSWFFEKKDKDQPEPSTTSDLKTERFEETLAFAKQSNFMLISIDEYLKRDAKPTLAVPHPSRLMPIVMQHVCDHMYIRVHRRVGNDRLLSDQEILDWAERVKEMIKMSNNELKHIWIIWNTNHEDHSMENASKLEKQLGPVCLDWKTKYVENQKANPGSIFSFLAKKPQEDKKARDAPKEKQEDEDDDEPHDNNKPSNIKRDENPVNEKEEQQAPKKKPKTATVQKKASSSPMKSIDSFFKKKN